MALEQLWAEGGGHRARTGQGFSLPQPQGGIQPRAGLSGDVSVSGVGTALAARGSGGLSRVLAKLGCL